MADTTSLLCSKVVFNSLFCIDVSEAKKLKNNGLALLFPKHGDFIGFRGTIAAKDNPSHILSFSCERDLFFLARDLSEAVSSPFGVSSIDKYLRVKLDLWQFRAHITNNTLPPAFVADIQGDVKTPFDTEHKQEIKISGSTYVVTLRRICEPHVVFLQHRRPATGPNVGPAPNQIVRIVGHAPANCTHIEMCDPSDLDHTTFDLSTTKLSSLKFSDMWYRVDTEDGSERYHFVGEFVCRSFVMDTTPRSVTSVTFEILQVPPTVIEPAVAPPASVTEPPMEIGVEDEPPVPPGVDMRNLRTLISSIPYDYDDNDSNANRENAYAALVAFGTSQRCNHCTVMRHIGVVFRDRGTVYAQYCDDCSVDKIAKAMVRLRPEDLTPGEPRSTVTVFLDVFRVDYAPRNQMRKWVEFNCKSVYNFAKAHSDAIIAKIEGKKIKSGSSVIKAYDTVISKLNF